MPEFTRIDTFARAGYAARGAVYALLGYFAFATRHAAGNGPEGVFETVSHAPLGTVLLWALTLGLLAYGLYKLAGSILDIDRVGHDAKGVAVRGGMIAGAVAYLGMAWGAAKFATGLKDQASGDGSADMAGTVLDLPLGNLVLALAGVGFILAALFQAKNAADKGFMKHIAQNAPPFTCTLGQIGFAARALVFALIGWSVLRSALTDRQGEVRDLGGVLLDLRDNGSVYLVVAAGLIVFGVYSLILSRYRIVPKVDVAEAAQAKAHAKLG